jgi:alkylation response protein AidB-like acyl-CoA dehydrogenase
LLDYVNLFYVARVPPTNALDAVIAERLERLIHDRPLPTTDPVTFHGARFDAGLAWVHYPEGCGGLGADPDQQGLVERRLAEVGAPSPFATNPIGIGMVGPTIVHHGTDDQRRRHLRRLWTGEDVWCQLFSEPTAGSDLASLATRAVPKGDSWVVDGQKVWTSLADRARYALLLARTDVDAPKNRGMTAFLLDMQAPGVEVRPLRQMTGDAEFSEVFLDRVEVSDEARLGPEGRGWQVAMTTLMNERASIGDALATHGAKPAEAALDHLRMRGRSGGPADLVRRDRVVRLWIEAEVVRLVAERAAALGQSGDPGPVGSVGKLLGAEHGQRIHELLVDLLGSAAMLWPERDGHGWSAAAGPQVAFLRSRAYTIEGGTSEVMRNILAERILGLPRDDHGPRDRPWREIPRN